MGKSVFKKYGDILFKDKSYSSGDHIIKRILIALGITTAVASIFLFTPLIATLVTLPALIGMGVVVGTAILAELTALVVRLVQNKLRRSRNISLTQNLFRNIEEGNVDSIYNTLTLMNNNLNNNLSDGLSNDDGSNDIQHILNDGRKERGENIIQAVWNSNKINVKDKCKLTNILISMGAKPNKKKVDTANSKTIVLKSFSPVKTVMKQIDEVKNKTENPEEKKNLEEVKDKISKIESTKIVEELNKFVEKRRQMEEKLARTMMKIIVFNRKKKSEQIQKELEQTQNKIEQLNDELKQKQKELNNSKSLNYKKTLDEMKDSSQELFQDNNKNQAKIS